MRYLKYTHAAAIGYNPDITYELNEIINKEGMDKAKAFFTPVNFKWEDLNRAEKVVNNKRNR